MNLRLIKLILLFFIFLVEVTACKPTELKITSIELCENFGSDGICREKLESEHTYNVKVNRPKKFETWEALGNYLYFTSRQTPGFIVRFNRKFTLSEKELLHKTYKSNYEFYGSIGHVEGFELGDNWVGSFQYLGSILKDRQRLFKEDKNFPYLENVFPSSLKFSFDSALVRGKVTTEINLKLNHNE